MIATVDNPSNAAEWALAEMVNRLVSLLSVLPQLKFLASYATGHQRWHSKAARGTARRLVLGQQARHVWETQASIFFLALCTGCLILQGEGQ